MHNAHEYTVDDNVIDVLRLERQLISSITSIENVWFLTTNINII